MIETLIEIIFVAVLLGFLCLGFSPIGMWFPVLTWKRWVKIYVSLLIIVEIVWFVVVRLKISYAFS